MNNDPFPVDTFELKVYFLEAAHCVFVLKRKKKINKPKNAIILNNMVTIWVIVYPSSDPSKTAIYLTNVFARYTSTLYISL